MTVLLIALGSAILYLIAYFTYGKWLGSKLFRLSVERVTPAYELERRGLSSGTTLLL